MKLRRSLWARILLAMTGIVIIGFGALTLFAGQQISTGTINDYKGRTVEQAQLIARGLKDPVEHLAEGEASSGALADSLLEYASQFDIKVTLLQGNGRYWLGEPFLSTIDSQSAPEVTAAMLGRTIENTRSGPDGQLAVYTAAPIYEDGRLLALVHIASPVAGAQSLVWQRWLTLIFGFLILAALAVAISLWLATSLTKPLAQMRHTALQIAQGDFSQRLPENREDEIGQLAIAFNYMAGEVEAMIEEQRGFASNASHELRTPLTAIRLRSEALRDGILDEQTARQYIIEIDDEAVRLGDLVEDLILVSRLDSGRMEIGHEEIDPVRFVQRTAQEFKSVLEESDIQLNLELPDEIPSVQTSLSHLQVVFRNILLNAIKYTPAGGHIDWSITVDGDYFQSTMSDSGKGIAAEDLDHLFERFYRADKAHSREIPGVGLGLSLVKMIVEFYGGTIVLDSPGVNEGSTAVVKWPFHPPEGADAGS